MIGCRTSRLDDDTDPTLSDRITFTDLTPGQFSIAEAAVPGYAITGLTCDTPNYGATADTIFVTLNSGDNVTCTFTNTEFGSVTIIKNAVADTPADQGQDFTFFTSFGQGRARRRHRPHAARQPDVR